MVWRSIVWYGMVWHGMALALLWREPAAAVAALRGHQPTVGLLYMHVYAHAHAHASCMPSLIMLCNDMPYHAIVSPCTAAIAALMLCRAMLCHAMSCYAMPCHKAAVGLSHTLVHTHVQVYAYVCVCVSACLCVMYTRMYMCV